MLFRVSVVLYPAIDSPLPIAKIAQAPLLQPGNPECIVVLLLLRRNWY